MKTRHIESCRPRPALSEKRKMPANLGARYFGPGRCEFLVWAPQAKRVQLRLVAPRRRLVPLVTDGSGYHWTVLSDVEPGTEYLFRLNGGLERPDPASRCQPHGVHGPSAVVDPAYNWKDRAWKGLALERFVIYELHTGTFSPEGTFAGIIPWLDILKNLGVTVLGIIPVAQFPGARNWGYDGVYPFAAQQSYGGATELKRLIDACHQRGLAVMLDVVYNHLGPEGSYLRDFGPYFIPPPGQAAKAASSVKPAVGGRPGGGITRNYRTPWGEALNFDGPGSDEVRRFFIESAGRWLDEFHIDALRLDSVRSINDCSARHFVEELAAAAHEIGRAQGRLVQIIAESSLNDPRVTLPPACPTSAGHSGPEAGGGVIRPSADGGWGCDAQYCKDFHHSLHVALTGERSGQYRDFAGLSDLARSYRDAFVYTGQYSACRRSSHGRSAAGRPASQFLVFAQDHDEAGNRPRGERLAALADFETLKLAAGAVALSPFIPFLFMGEEYGEEAPFLYFTSHSDKSLAEAVRLGRRREFNSVADNAIGPRQARPSDGHSPCDTARPQASVTAARNGKIPDPNKESAFLRSRLNQGLRHAGKHAVLESFYRRLYALRRGHPALAKPDRENLDVALHEEAGILTVRRRAGGDEAFFALHFAKKPGRLKLELPGGTWIKLLDSAEMQWGGPGSTSARRLAGGPAELSLSPRCVVLYGKTVA